MNVSFLKPLTTLSKKIGLDLGTSRIRVWSDQDGFVIDEPACVAIDLQQNKVLAVGAEAQAMVGRLGDQVQVIFPILAGAIRDQAIAEAMLRVFIQRVVRTTLFFRPLVMVSVPASLAEPEKIALTEVLFAVGFREVNFIDQVLAAAIGAGVPIADTSGSFFLHMGAGMIEAGIISMSAVVSAQTTPEAGLQIDRELRRQIRAHYHLEVGRVTAERVKKQVVHLVPGEQLELRISGRDIVDGSPKEMMVNSTGFRTMMKPFVDQYVATVKQVFRHLPPELATDVIDKGVLLTGGLSQLKGLEAVLVEKLEVPVSVVDDPDQVVIKGIAQVLENIELFRQSTGYRYEAARNG